MRVAVPSGVTAQHQAYLALLAKWNATVNLTALKVDPPDAAALDRLIGEPLRAARFVRPDDRLAVDLGSGGGSPALPLKIACPGLRFVLVESRERKCAFLREAVRTLELTHVEVEQLRLEDLRRRDDLKGRVDLVTMRAIRAYGQTWRLINWLLGPDGQVLWFGGSRSNVPTSLVVAHDTAPLLVLRRSSPVDSQH